MMVFLGVFPKGVVARDSAASTSNFGGREKLDKNLQDLTRIYKGLQALTRAYKGLQGLTSVNKGNVDSERDIGGSGSRSRRQPL